MAATRPVYIQVMDEWDTIRTLLKGRRSLARYGDGEIKLMDGASTKSQPFREDLGARLREVAVSKVPNLYVGIPRIWDEDYTKLSPQKQKFYVQYRQGPRARFWDRKKRYVSQWVTRMDHFPDLDTPEFWQSLRNIWQGRDVLFLRGGAKGDEPGQAPLVNNARSVEHVPDLPPQDAWPLYPELMQRCRAWAQSHPDGCVVLCLGATATVMAHDLAAEGIQGLDLGHAPLFLAQSPHRDAVIAAGKLCEG